MKVLPLAIKILLNLFFFCIYLLISIVLWDFIYGFVLDKILLKAVPWSNDIIHMKIALIVWVLTLIFTMIFRKIFYIKLINLEDSEIKK